MFLKSNSKDQLKNFFYNFLGSLQAEDSSDKKKYICVFQMKTLDNIVHAISIVRGETPRGIFD